MAEKQSKIIYFSFLTFIIALTSLANEIILLRVTLVLFPEMLSETITKVYNIAGIIIFAGLTAYDTQKIKNMNLLGNEGTEADRKETVSGALTLYLDFINLFLFILRMTGSKRR